MAKRNFLVDIDLNKNQLLNTKMQNVAVLPTLGASDAGMFYWNTANKQMYIWDGTAFVDNTYQHPNHTGDVTSVADGATTISNNVVTNAKLSTVATQTIKGRISSGSGNVEDLTAANVRSIINVESGAQVNVETDLKLTSQTATALTIVPVMDGTPSLTGTTVTLTGATTSLAGLMSAADKTKLDGIEANADVTDATNVAAAGAVMTSMYDASTILVANTDNTPITLSIGTNSVVGRLNGNIQTISLDYDISSTSALNDSIPSALAVKNYVDSMASPTGHTHSMLYQPNGTNPFVYTDNSGALHIDGNIIQSGSTYETHAEHLYTTKDVIILRDGATTGLAVGEYTGIVAKLYDGVNDGRLIFGSDGVARVGDQGFEQPLATREETPLNNGFAYWVTANNRFETKTLGVVDISNLNTWTGSTAIRTVGTITGGTWNGTIIAPAYGGTGVNNGTRTLTINTNSGTLSFAQAASTLTINGTSSISGTNTGDQTITLSGDVTTTAMTNGTYAATLPNIATAGTFNKVVVNAKGLVTSGTTEVYGIKKSFDITGNGVNTSFTLTHNLNTFDIVTFIRLAAGGGAGDTIGQKVEAEEIVNTVNTLIVNFNVAPPTGTNYKVTIVG